ncbi:hypothetical protein [Amycolatopsis sp. NPDC051071]|uniref:hypothetical protein n=1 Tax=Amycolatopsis sp. NPDC051071 TaxID=3154637 RepID=UPI003418852A
MVRPRGPAWPTFFAFVLLAAAGLHIPFSLQIIISQGHLPHRVGTASGVTLGLTVSIGGLGSPVLGKIADHTSLRTALIPLGAPKKPAAVDRPKA